MDHRTRSALAGGLVVGIFLLVQLGALALVEPFRSAGYQVVEDPQDPSNSLAYLLAILGVTGLMLLALRFDADRAIRGFVVFAAGYISWFVFGIFLPAAVVVGGVGVLPVAAAVALAVALYAYPEWYVIDAAGVVVGAGAAGLFGISFGLLPALVLLVALAAYDALSVYRTEHMLTLASGMMDLKVPIVLVAPLTLSYSFLDADLPDPTEDEQSHEGDGTVANGGADDPEPDGGAFEREALFIGLGDAVVPTVLVASAAFFAPPSVPTLPVPGVALTLPALTAMLGTLAGLVVLLRLVLRGRAHAGLPLLNGGAIAGYLVGALASGVGLVEALGLPSYL